ncbi:MAG: DUF1570 domain-containing protein [Victivallales bacterium]|nr:DUF1570 domain-containing protein [Victivallales bacterium]MCF7888758.1 DUF1570 domain-containing protein [Victivallales bacterium]
MNQSYNKIIYFFIIFLCTSGYAGRIDLGERINLPQIGMSFEFFEDMKDSPAAIPDIYKTKKSGRNVYKSLGIWKYKQFAGRWSNEFSVITAAVMHTPLPANDSLLTVDKAKRRYNKRSSTVNWKESSVKKWLNLYFGLKKIKKLIEFDITKTDLGVLYYSEDKSFRYFTGVIKERSRLKRNVALCFKTVKDISKKKAAKYVFDSMNSIRYIKIESDNAANIVFFNKEARLGFKKDSSLKKILIISNIRNFENWKLIVSEDYYILTDCKLDRKEKNFLLNVAETLEKSKIIYEKFYEEQRSCRDKFTVRIFKSRDGYSRYLGKDMEWSGGVWIASKRELVLTKSDYTRSEKERFMRVLRHEGFHQYIYYALGELRSAAWFNEGNAVFFENCELFGSKIYIKPSKNKLEYFKKHLLEDSNLADKISVLLKKNYQEFYSRKHFRRDYSLAWALVYFLNTENRFIRNRFHRNYSGILPLYYKMLWDTRNSKTATNKAWKGVNFKYFSEAMAFYFRTQVSRNETNIQQVIQHN